MASHIENNLLEIFSSALDLDASSIDAVNNDGASYDELKSNNAKNMKMFSENLEGNLKRDLTLRKIINHEKSREDKTLILSENAEKCSGRQQTKKNARFQADVVKKRKRNLLPRYEVSG